MLRTVTCGELTKEFEGKEVVLSGWVFRRRDHGKLIFIDLRDRYGWTQVVFIPSQCKDSYELASDLRSEFVVQIKGIVNPRPKGTINPDLKTGEVEVMAKELVVLNASLTPPFEPEGCEGPLIIANPIPTLIIIPTTIKKKINTDLPNPGLCITFITLIHKKIITIIAIIINGMKSSNFPRNPAKPRSNNGITQKATIKT